ncbi:MAG: right-handed parallel beta-helix repeat-containing protein [Thermonemataceae bacterium]
MRNNAWYLMLFLAATMCQPKKVNPVETAVPSQVEEEETTSNTRVANTVVVKNTSALMKAVNEGKEGDIVHIKAGTYYLKKSLKPKNGMILKGDGIGKTILKGHSDWKPSTNNLPEHVDSDKVNASAYLINLGYGTPGVNISQMTLQGPQLHGGIYGNNCDQLKVFQVKIQDFLWCGIRTYRMDGAAIYSNTFVDAGGKFGNSTGGGIYVTWVKASNFYNNHFSRSSNSKRPFYGIKGRQGYNCRIYQNTIRVNFSIEFPHEHDENMEIDHNYITGTVSIPRHEGGKVPPSGSTFHIHHNYFTSSYAIEGSRNGLEINNNLFDFSTDKDHGNLVSSWTPKSPGPVKFHDNYIKNPGRGIFWTTHVYNGVSFYNNHVITNTTITPRTEGLFGLPKETNFSTIKIFNNIIECKGTARPLMRNTESYKAVIHNNKLTNVKDKGKFKNASTGNTKGPRGDGKFSCGVNGAYKVNRWSIQK